MVKPYSVIVPCPEIGGQANLSVFCNDKSENTTRGVLETVPCEHTSQQHPVVVNCAFKGDETETIFLGWY